MNDILLDTDYDLAIINGDLSVGDSTVQRQQSIVLDGKNDWKQHPTTGVGALGFIDDEEPQAFFVEIREQMVMDGMKVNKLEVTPEGSIYIDAK